MKKLLEQARQRAKDLNHSDPHFADRIYEAMKHSQNEFETLGLTTGYLLAEKSNELTVSQAVAALKDDPEFKRLEDRDLEDFCKYFIDQGAGSLIFAPDVMNHFISFSKRVGFPVTLGGAERGGLEAPRYSTKTLLRVLVGAHVLTVSEVPAVDAMDAKHSGEEAKFFKENPKFRVDVYEYDLGFLREVGYVMRSLGVKEESINQKPFSKTLEEKYEFNTRPDRALEDLDAKLKTIMEASKDDEEEAEEKGSHDKILREFDDDKVEKLVDGLLVVLGELEQTGEIPRIESPEQAKDVIMAAIKKLYQKRDVVSRLSRKYARFGAKKVLRRARQDIQKAMESSKRLE